MVLRNPHLKEVLKNRSPEYKFKREGYSFDYWAKQAHKGGPTKTQIAKTWLRRTVQITVLLVVFAIISVFALRWQANDFASLECDSALAQKSGSSMLAFGGCKKTR